MLVCCMYAFTNVSMCGHVCLWMYTYAHVHIRMYLHAYVCMPMSVYVLPYSNWTTQFLFTNVLQTFLICKLGWKSNNIPIHCTSTYNHMNYTQLCVIKYISIYIYIFVYTWARTDILMYICSQYTYDTKSRQPYTHAYAYNTYNSCSSSLFFRLSHTSPDPVQFCCFITLF